MANIQIALPEILEYEGGYSNDPKDSGRETFYGISRKAWPKWKGWALVDKQSQSGVKPTINSPELNSLVENFYSENFWKPLRCDEINDQWTAFYLFDFAVNAGIESAVKALQRALGVKIDGDLGPKTLYAANNNKDSNFKKKFISYRLLHYVYCVARNPLNIRFILGWINRSLTF